jgi:hypothetical protein
MPVRVRVQLISIGACNQARAKPQSSAVDPQRWEALMLTDKERNTVEARPGGTVVKTSDDLSSD